jgi:hypothetical protein
MLGVSQWWCEEMAKARLLMHCRRDHEEMQTGFNAFLNYMIAGPADSRSVHLSDSGDSESKTGGHDGAGESERQAMVTYAVKTMPTELFTELLEGIKMPGQVLQDWDLCIRYAPASEELVHERLRWQYSHRAETGWSVCWSVVVVVALLAILLKQFV